MRNLSLTAIAAVGIFGLVGLFAPASAQTDPPPERTPEATAETGPFDLILRAARRCILSPDENLVAIADEGVYDLADGSLRFSLAPRESNPTQYLSFTHDSRRLFVRGDAVYDTATGNRIMPLFSSPTGSANARWLATPMGIYDLETGEKVYDMQRERLRGRIHDLWVPTDKDIAFVSFGSPVFGGVILDIPSGDIVQDFSGSVVVDGGLTRIAVIGEALYAIGSDTPLVRLPEEDYTPVFSSDGQRLLLYNREEVRLYDAVEGVLLNRIPAPLKSDLRHWNAYFVSSDLLHIYGDVLIAPGTNQMQVEQWNWVYTVPEGELLFDYEGEIWFWGGARQAWYAADTGIFDPQTGEVFVPSPVSLSRSYAGRIIRFNDGEYDPDTFERVFAYAPALNGTPIFDDAYRYAGVQGEGIFDAQTGELLMRLRGDLYITRNGRYALSSTQNACAVYRLPEL